MLSPTLLSPTILAASGLLLLAVGVAVALGLELRRFLARMPVLTSISGVVAFRRVVTRQMYGALVVLLLAIAAFAVAGTGLYLRHAQWQELPVLLGVGACFAVVGIWTRVIEARAKSIRVVDDEIGRRRDEIVRVWMSRPLPRW